MQYVKCIVTRPGLFDNVVFEFKDKLNIITGKNGAGKSVLAKGLVDSIFNRFNKIRLLPGELWNNMYFDVLFFTDDNKLFQFTTNCQKKFTIRSHNNSKEHVLYSKDVLTDGENYLINVSDIEVDINLNNFIKKIDFNLFVGTSFIPSPSDFEINKLINYQDIQRLILCDRSDFFKKQGLLKGYFEKGNKSENRILSEILKYENISKNLNREIQLIEIQNARHGKLKKERDVINREIETHKIKAALLSNRIEILYKIYDSLEKIDDYQKSFIKINEEVEKEKKKINSISELKNEIETFFPQFKNFKNISNNYLDKLQQIYNEIRSLNEKIDILSSRLDQRKERLKKIGLAVNISSLAVIFSVFYKNDFSISDDLFVLTGLFGFSLIFTLLSFLYHIAASGAKKFSRLNDEKRELEEKLKKILEESNLELEGYKLSELYEFLLQYFEDYIQYSESLDDIKNISKSLKDHKDLKVIKMELNVIKKRDSDAKNEIDKYINALDIGHEIELDKSKIKELIARSESEIRVLEKQFDLKKNILDQIDVELNLNPDSNVESGSLVVEKARVDKVLGSLNKTEKSIYFIMELIDEAVKKVEEKQLLHLVDMSYENFNFLTGNQYISQIDKDIIRNIITGRMAGGELNPIMVHVLLLTIKISLTDFFTDNNISLPLIIDDPFLLMDDDRISRFRELILSVSDKRQVILFTHHRDKKEWGNFMEL